jgi:pyruvate/2-oxoglutarate dehydrogenase complex dihydrolipoamide acyltransferase (E2) component
VKGPLFTTTTPTGDKATHLLYSFGTYDVSKSAWDNWSIWTPINWNSQNSTTYQSELQPGKSKIAFAILAINTCGISEQARENSTGTGVALATAQELAAADKAAAAAAEAANAAAANAAAEAADAANAATDAANAAAEAAAAATAAALEAADAVAALSQLVETLISDLKAQLTSLTNLIVKIQNKLKG